MQTSIQEFTLALLAYKGALVEPDDRSAGVFLGTELGAILGMDDYQRFVFDPLLDEPGAIRVDYDTPTFEAIGRLAGSMGKLACVRIAMPELKAIDPENELERALRLHNGVFRLRECAPVETLYFCFFLQYDVMADERSGGVAELWVNPSTRSIPQIVPPVDVVELTDAPAPPEFVELATQAWRLASPGATMSIHSRLRGFTESLNRRRERDLRRMADYYQAIDEEVRRKIARAGAKGSARNSEIQRLEATARAYQTRAAEMLERYTMNVRISGIGTLACLIPSYRLRVQLLRRTRTAEALFSWNPFGRRIESRCCDACGQPTEAAALCDDQVHYLCLDCLEPCQQCSRVFCRACHRRCPRSHG